MSELPRTSAPDVFRSLLVIAIVIAGGAAAFAYTAGWFSPQRLTPDRIVDALAPPAGVAPGHRRNHAKGICFTGHFEANGAGAQLSRAQVFKIGRYPVVGRFNLAPSDLQASDGTTRVRGLGLRISTPDGEEWRTGLLDSPFFPVSTPQAFYELLIASGSKDPEMMTRFVAAHPEIAAFGAWAATAPWTGSYAEQRYNGLNSFVFVDDRGGERVVRWSLLPAARAVPMSPDDLKKRGPDFLAEEIVERVGSGPAQWSLVVTIANQGDPTSDPSKAWPEERRAVEVGSLVVEQVEAERDGRCRDINFDPTVLPSGIRTSDDPFPAARSAAYAKSFNRRTAEDAAYPRSSTEAKR